MTGLISRWWYGGHGLSVLKRNILGLIGVSPIRATIHGLIEGVSDHKRKFWLADPETMGRDAN